MMKHPFIAFFFFAVLVSCIGHDPEDQDTIGQFVTSVSVSCQQPRRASGITREGDGADDRFIITDTFTEGDKLYFSQLPPTGNPNFTNPYATDNPLYIYSYDGSRQAEWNTGYNFSRSAEDAEKGTPIFNWRKVKEIGSVGNAFSLYAMYFPVDNNYRLEVEKDQRGSEDKYDMSNFQKSDIMGAYHATSSLYTRLRFRLFHLMVYLKVKLYVPVLETNEGTDTDFSFSGFDEGAVQSAQVRNVSTQLNIEWRANRSSDTEAPLTQQATGEKTKIFMYEHKPNEDVETIKIADYYTNEQYGKDRVRAYEFSVLFPMQTVGDNFLCFTLKSPYSDEKRYYYFSGSQIVGDKSDSYGLTQGTLQELHLYLPRKTNETVLVGAKILPWLPAETDMTVTQDPQSND